LPQKGEYVSGFSLSSISLKNKAKKNNTLNSVAEEERPSSPFKQEDLMAVWTQRIKDKREGGESNLAAILEMDAPKLGENFEITFQVVNTMNKRELMHEMESFLPLLKEKLNNYTIRFSIRVKENQQLKEEHPSNTREKYELLLKSYPALELFKKEFDLKI